MRSFTNVTRKYCLGLIVFSLLCLWLSWEWKIFMPLLVAGGIFFGSVAYIFKSSQLVLIPISSILICLSLIETSLLLFYDKPKTYFDRATDYSSYSYFERVKGFGYRVQPGVHTSRELTHDGEVIYDVSYTIGKDGYRESSSGGKFNAYIFGGSHTFGEGLNDNETLAHYLSLSPDLKVKNLGVHGYGMHQALYNIENGISSLDGTNILLTAPWHSARSACKPSYTVGTPKYIIVEGYAALKGVCKNNNILIKILAQSKIFILTQRSLIHESRQRNDDFDLYLAILRTIAKKTHENGSKLVISYIKGKKSEFKNTNWTNESLMQELNKIGDIFIDVTLSKTREELDNSFYLHELDPHPSSEANKVRAMMISSAIKKDIS